MTLSTNDLFKLYNQNKLIYSFKGNEELDYFTHSSFTKLKDIYEKFNKRPIIALLKDENKNYYVFAGQYYTRYYYELLYYYNEGDDFRLDKYNIVTGGYIIGDVDYYIRSDNYSNRYEYFDTERGTENNDAMKKIFADNSLNENLDWFFDDEDEEKFYKFYSLVNEKEYRRRVRARKYCGLFSKKFICCLIWSIINFLLLLFCISSFVNLNIDICLIYVLMSFNLIFFATYLTYLFFLD